ncbi:MAG: translocation/assembly module TamB [candidate division Zixibacteria bacterium]|nr:translocation/assembly module TamB [candidate division Zixibacteria bacterium]
MRRVWKITFYLFCLVMLIIIGGWVYFLHLGGLERLANSRLEALLADQPEIEAEIGQISGDIISSIVVKDISLYYIDGAERHLLLEIPRLETIYSLSNLMNQQYSLDYLHIDSAVVTIVRDSTGRWLLPKLTTDSGGEASRAMAFRIGDLALNQTTVRFVDGIDTILVENLLLWSMIEFDNGTAAVDLQRLEFTTNKERVILDAAAGTVTYANGNILFKDMNIFSGDTRIRLSGNVATRDSLTGHVSVIADNIDLGHITRYVGPHLKGVLDLNSEVSFAGGRVEGTADIAGDFMIVSFDNLHMGFQYADKHLTLDTLYGTILGGCSVDGWGGVDFSTAPLEEYHLTADIKNFNLKQLITNSFESNLSGQLRMDGQSFRKSTMVMAISTELYESSFDEYPLHEAAGNMIITSDSITFVDSFRVNYFENVFHTSGRVSYRDDIDLSVRVKLNNLDRYRGKLFIDQPGGRGYAEGTISGLTADPDLHGFFASDSVWVYELFSDSMYARVDMDRFLTSKQGKVAVSFFDGQAWPIPYDTGYAWLTTDSNLVYIDSLQVSSQSVQLDGQGMFNYGPYPQRLLVNSLTLHLWDRPFHNRGDLQIDIDSAGFVFDKADIGNSEAQLSVQGRADYDEALELQVSVVRVPLAPWVNLVDTIYEIDGVLSGDATLRGTISEPIFNLLGFIDSLTYKDLVLGDLMTAMAYRDRLLTLDSVRLVSHPGEYVAGGSLHADLSLSTDRTDRFPDLPMDIAVVASDTRFDLVSLLMPTVEHLTGDFHADFRLSGTPQDPHLDGEAYINGARLKYFDLEHPIFADSVGATMHDNRIVIEGIELFTTENKKENGRRRYAQVEGEIIVEALDTFYYDLDVTTPKEFPFAYELDDIQGKAEGDLHIEGSSPPLVTGSLTLTSMRYQVEFAEQDEGSPLMMALSSDDEWNLNINIDILSNYWIRNEDIDAEFAGQLNLIRTDGNYRFIGEMEILRGRGFLFDKTFRLEPGSRVIFEGNDTLNPRLDITGYTRIAGVVEDSFGDDATPETVELCVDIGGTLELPEINPCEGSDMTREDILPLIVANYYARDGFSSSGQIEQRLFGLGYSQMSQIGARQLNQIGVETFEIDPVYGQELNPWNARVTLGFYTAPRLYVYGRSTLAGQTRQELGFDYRLSKAFQVEGRRDEEELYHLSLKFHWEF